MEQLQAAFYTETGVPEEWELGRQKIFEEIKDRNFPNLMKLINPQIQGVQ